MNPSGNQKVIFDQLLGNMPIQQNPNAPLYFTKSMGSQQTVRPVPNGGTESDLTELSWLTNGMNVLSKTASTDDQLDLRCIQEKENFSNIDDLDSSFSSTISSTSFSSTISSSSSSASSINTKKKGIQVKNGQNRDTCPLNLTKDTPITSIEQFKAFFNRKKPPLTINCLIFMAIEESASKCLPVRDIYNWIETNFPSYKSLAHGWKSSIRHNLSFSKCFRKMDRLESCKYFKSKSLTGHNASKPRPSSSFGTCWKVNTDCRDYLIHALRKSSFWTKYNRFYPNLVDLVQNSHCDSIVSNHHVYHTQRHHPNKAYMRKDKKQQECHKHDIMDEDVSSSSLSWLTNTSSSLSTSYLSDNDDNNDDVAKAAEILAFNKLTNSKRQLFHHKPFSYLNLNNHATVNIINSDLEFEVASTLVRMKSLIETRN